MYLLTKIGYLKQIQKQYNNKNRHFAKSISFKRYKESHADDLSTITSNKTLDYCLKTAFSHKLIRSLIFQVTLCLTKTLRNVY